MDFKPKSLPSISFLLGEEVLFELELIGDIL